MSKRWMNLLSPWIATSSMATYLVPAIMITFCHTKCNGCHSQGLFTFTKAGGVWKSACGWVKSGDGDYCKRQGITCNTNGCVIKILLPNNGLQAMVLETIFFLEYLTKMDLSHNEIKLPFWMADLALPTQKHRTLPALINFTSNGPCNIFTPSGIGSFGRFEELYLHDNELQGTIPMTIEQLQNLKIVSLAKNQLTGMLPNAQRCFPSWRCWNHWTWPTMIWPAKFRPGWMSTLTQLIQGRQ